MGLLAYVTAQYEYTKSQTNKPISMVVFYNMKLRRILWVVCTLVTSRRA